MNRDTDRNPDFIMGEYPWSLDMDKLTLQQADSIFGMIDPEHELDFSKIVIKEPSARIKYRYGQYNERLKNESFVMKADNGKNFSAREVLFKINNQTAKHLKNDPHYFFEGLEFEGYEDGMPVYTIAQGS